MPWSIRARAPTGDASSAVTSGDVAAYLEDAAHVPGGHAARVARPATEAAVAEVLRSSPRVIVVGAQSSLTGGATPMGETVLSTSRLNRIEAIGHVDVRAQSGVTLDALDAALAGQGRRYPPTPTFTGAFVGGVIATNAAGAATFKYGATRDWVSALTVVLPDGDVLDITRGETRAHRDGYFDLDLNRGRVRVPIPAYRMPPVPKVSAGYYAAPTMDLIDLFIGSEGTLGVVTAATLRVQPARPAVCLALVPFPDRPTALQVAADLRAAARATWQSGDPRGLDVAAIEHLDARALAVIREDGADRACGVTVPERTALALLVTLELPPGTRAEAAFDEIGRAREHDAPDTPLVRFCAMLAVAGVLDHVEMAAPGDARRAAQLLAFREAAPATVNRRIALAQRTIDGRIEKTAGDLLVPVADLPAFLERCDDEFRRRGLDAANWGHLSDGNLHPNVIPRSFADVEAGRDALRVLGREAIRLGGVPLAEHGVGRSAVKQALLRELYGADGIEQMRRVKAAIDPDGKLAPGVLFAG